MVWTLGALLLFVVSATALSRTKPPAGAVVVKPGVLKSGWFTSIGDAVNSLPNDTSAQTVFIYPGTYHEHVNISRPGPVTVYGYTRDVMDFNQNTVNIIHNASLATGAGSDDLTGTLRIHSNDVALYNIDLTNNFGVAHSNGQAIAISNYGSRVGAYACRFFSYQDTLYSNQGTQVYLKSYIEGAVDFIFGRLGQAYFEGNVIASKGAGCITASGREANNSAIYVFDHNSIISAPDAFQNVSGEVFLGRPWGDFAKVVFKNTYIGPQLNKTVWSTWNPGDPRTDNILFAEYNSFGPGVIGAHRPNFSTILTGKDAAQYNISTTVGDDYKSWVDLKFLLPSSL